MMGKRKFPMNPQTLRFSPPVTHENLSVFFIAAPELIPGTPYLDLQGALQAGKAAVRETGDVNSLLVENLDPEKDLFLQACDLLRGGRQDRTLAVDLILGAKSGQTPVMAFCVESGRWRSRGDESVAHFSGSPRSLHSRRLRTATRLSKDQMEVWKEVSTSQQLLAASLGASVRDPASGSSLELSLDHARLRERAKGFRDALLGAVDAHGEAVGCAFTVNGLPASADLYGNRALFGKLWPKLLDASIHDAVESQGQSAIPSPADAETFRRFFADAEGSTPHLESPNARTRCATRARLEGWLFDTLDLGRGEACLHRNYLPRRDGETPSSFRRRAWGPASE